MDRIEAKKSVLAIVKQVDDVAYDVLSEKKNIEYIKLSEYFDSLSIVLLNIEILARYPEAVHTAKEPLRKDTTMGDLINFFVEEL